MSNIMTIILFGALATYISRITGHLVLSRFSTIPPRVEAALNAVPAAVLTTIVVPAAVDAGPIEMVVVVAGALLALKLPPMGVFVSAWILLVILRQLFGG